MPRTVSKIVVVGGGTAGWLTACSIAAEHVSPDSNVEVTLVESPDIPTIGVGEGTWPSMRATLQQIGMPEDELFRYCDATFKQGTSFNGWSGAGSTDQYYHPFSPPVEYSTLNLAGFWLANQSTTFADFVTSQVAVIDRGLAPKQLDTPPYAFVANYAYHLDAGKFAERLHIHGTDKLGVKYVSANVTRLEPHENGDLKALVLDSDEKLEGDLFVDCTGHRSLLLAGHFGAGFHSVKQYLFNDSAIAVQVPYDSDKDPLPSTTLATATKAGWIWDIGLQTRRGVGHVYSSSHTTEEQATAVAKAYIENTTANSVDELNYRSLHFEPGYRDKFWIRNCVAVGMSAGFVEPLEASAIALIEQAAKIISQQLPVDRSLMDIVADRFNRKMSYHWTKIVEFLKLHYVLSERSDSAYWMDATCESNCPAALTEKLMLWQQQPPWHDDAPMVDELFPSASYQYVLYGMNYTPRYRDETRRTFREQKSRVDTALHEKVKQAGRMVSLLPANRELINAIRGKYE